MTSLDVVSGVVANRPTPVIYTRSACIWANAGLAVNIVTIVTVPTNMTTRMSPPAIQRLGAAIAMLRAIREQSERTTSLHKTYAPDGDAFVPVETARRRLRNRDAYTLTASIPTSHKFVTIP